jgi:hypothetical protein
MHGILYIRIKHTYTPPPSITNSCSKGPLHLSNPEAQFLDEIQTKVLRVFLLAIHSHLDSFALRFLFLLKLTQPLTVATAALLLYTVKGKGGKPDRKLLYTHFPRV